VSAPNNFLGGEMEEVHLLWMELLLLLLLVVVVINHSSRRNEARTGCCEAKGHLEFPCSMLFKK
jgi:hypothetical protein